jgi:hypothetical protein
MTPLVYPYLNDVKLTSELLMAFKRLLPKLTDKSQIRKVKREIEIHEKYAAKEDKWT